jgi:hypothetical protein
MANGKQAYVNGDVFHLVQKEHHAKKEKDMVVSGHHVLGPKVSKRDKLDPPDFLDVSSVTGGNVMSQRCACADTGKKATKQ